MSGDQQQQRLKQTFEALRQALEEAESALIEYEETLGGDSPTSRSQSRTGLELLSIPEVCQELGMGKSWVYKRIRSGEIPSVKLGHNIKVRREALEGYLDQHPYRPSEEDAPIEGEGPKPT
ncbi:MAG: helix-turn-helix domain-containing protein [Actinobacteria bacterium]|nr:helix-turn-helix domain-containing protein [Actinomycetota bacterium]MCA1737512.1 helix-turn-helix domain-containing protein [Actinomycetota bacterium]